MTRGRKKTAGAEFLPKRKKDFKLSERLVREFERLAPSGKQTAIVERLISAWVVEQKERIQHAEMRRAYAKEGRRVR